MSHTVPANQSGTRAHLCICRPDAFGLVGSQPWTGCECIVASRHVNACMMATCIAVLKVTATKANEDLLAESCLNLKGLSERINIAAQELGPQTEPCYSPCHLTENSLSWSLTSKRQLQGPWQCLHQDRRHTRRSRAQKNPHLFSCRQLRCCWHPWGRSSRSFHP